MYSVRRIFPLCSVFCLAALALAGCPSNRNSESSGLPVVQARSMTAQLYAPSEVVANSTTKFKVGLVATDDEHSGTYPVRIVDVGSSRQKIYCGDAKYLKPGGASANFPCQVPETELGTESRHQLQVMVNGTPATRSPKLVEVVSEGLVKDELVSAESGENVTRAAPGQALKITFDISSIDKGKGRYTLDVPAGWLHGRSGACSLPSDVNGPTCSIAITVPPNSDYGRHYLRLSAEDGSTPLQATYLGLDVVPAALASAPAAITVLYAQNISATLYGRPRKQPSQAPDFKYEPVVVFENISKERVHISTADVSGLKQGTLRYSCGEPLSKGSNTPPAGCELDYVRTGHAPCPEACYYVTGELANLLPASASTMSTTVSADVRGDSGVLKTYTQPVTFVEYVPDHVAIRIVNVPGKHQVHIAASYNPLVGVDHPGQIHMIDFASAGIGKRLPYIEKNSKYYSGQAYAEYQYPASGKSDRVLTDSGGVIYLPYGNSESIYITRGNGFTTQQAPTPVGFGNAPGAPPPKGKPVASPSFVQFEPTYCQNARKDCPLGGETSEQLYMDLTYVNTVQYWALLQGMGAGISPTGSINGIPTQSLAFGKTSPESGATLFGKVNTALAKLGSPWEYNKANGTRNFIQTSPPGTAATAGTISMLIAPVQSGGTPLPPANPSFNPFHDLYGAAYYKPYLDALWKAVVGGTFKPQVLDLGHSLSTTEQCILVGTYQNQMLVFKAKNPNYCKTKTEGAPDYPPIEFRKFTACDFTVALSSTCGSHGLWGVKNSYRVNIGRALATYQAVGLLPQCTGSLVDNALMSAANLDRIVSGMKTTDSFHNPTCLKITGKPAGYTHILRYAVYNPYVAVLRPYVDVYTYTFSDFMGVSGLINWSQNLLSSAADKNMPRAQPITLTLY